MKNQAELVLTLPNTIGPELVYLSRARTTLGALTLIIAQSKEELVISAPYIKEDILRDGVLQVALEHAVQKRHVEISIVTTGESFERATNIPWIINNRTRVHLFRPKDNIDNDPNIGSHAKFCIADKEIAYIGSANLTYLGMHKHLEMGTLVYGEMANQVYDIWRLLIKKEFFIEN